MTGASKLTAETEAHAARRQEGYDRDGFAFEGWDGLTAAEAEVFAIEPARLARLVTAWDAYMAFQDLQHPAAYSDEALAEARTALVALVKAGVEMRPFVAFAEAVCGLNTREACAVFLKVTAWQVRTGLARFGDEPGADD